MTPAHHLTAVEVINPTGYTLRPTGAWEPGMGYLFGLGALWGWRRKRRQYEVMLDPVTPLTLRVSPCNCYCRPDRHGFTDLGSIPEVVESLIPRNCHEPGFLIHDSACREHGLYFSREYDGPYTFCPVNSDTTHRLLGLTVRALGGWPPTQWAIYNAVRRFGPQWSVGVTPCAA